MGPYEAQAVFLRPIGFATHLQSENSLARRAIAEISLRHRSNEPNARRAFSNRQRGAEPPCQNEEAIRRTRFSTIAGLFPRATIRIEMQEAAFLRTLDLPCALEVRCVARGLSQMDHGVSVRHAWHDEPRNERESTLDCCVRGMRESFHDLLAELSHDLHPLCTRSIGC